MENKLTPGYYYQPLFDLLNQEHGIIPLESEMADIITVVEKMQHLQPKAPTGPRWVKASSIEIKYATTYYAKWEDDKYLIKGTGWFQMLGGVFYWDKEGYVPIGVNERDNLMILDESATPAGREEGTDVFVPCAEDDPDRCGGYTSDDGRSLCYVKVQHVPVSVLKKRRANDKDHR